MPPNIERPEAEQALYNTLKADFTHAFLVDVRARMPTPTGITPYTSIVKLAAELLPINDELHMIEDALGVIAAASNSPDPYIRVPAQAWIARAAHFYADEWSRKITEGRHAVA